MSWADDSPFRRDRHRHAALIADALPIHHHAAGDRLRHDQRHFFLAGILGQRFDGGIVAGGDHGGGGHRQHMQTQARSKVEPFRLSGKVETDHGQ
jgi:hypothetical protein